MPNNEECFGVNLNEPVTPLIARDALVRCFTSAHMESLGLEEADEDSSREIMLMTIKKAFKDTGGHFDSPTKDEILGVSKYLREYSQNFRSPEVIEKHFKTMMSILEKIQD